MAISNKHKFTCAIADDPVAQAAGEVLPSHYNDEHDLILATGMLVGRTTAGTGAAEEIPIADFATAAQGATADSAVQPGDLATVATTGAYADLSGKPTLGTASANNTGDFATAAQGALADAAQPALSLTANTLYARSSSGAATNKTISDDALTFNAAANFAAMRTALGVPGLADANTWAAQNTFAIGTITTSKPHTISQTWNAAGVAFTGKLNSFTSTASSAASLMEDWQVGGVTQVHFVKDGTVRARVFDSISGVNLNIKTSGVDALLFSGGNMDCYSHVRGQAGTQTIGQFRRVVTPLVGNGTLNTVYNFRVLTNEGVTSKSLITLQSAAAGDCVEYACQDADGIRLIASTGDTIRVIDKVTATAGYIESTTIGSTVRLVAINATEWIAMDIHGVWTDGTFTFDDTGLTTP